MYTKNFSIRKKRIGDYVSIFKTRKFYRIFWLICIFLTVLACIKTIWISLDIDESYAIAQSYRLAIGERLFRDLWESHQLSGVYMAPFIWLFLKIAGTTSWIVIYTRIVGTVIQFLIGIFLVNTLKKHVSDWMLLMLFFLHMNFMPKWVQSPEFELLQYWFILLMFCCTCRYFLHERHNSFWLIITGLLLVGQMMLYPTLFVLYPIYLIGIVWCDKKRKLNRVKIIKDSTLFTLGALVPGLLFLGYLASYMTIADFFRYLGYIMQDESHTLVSTSVKWKIYLASFQIILLETIACIIVASIITWIIGKKKNFLVRMSTLVFCILGFIQLYGCAFGNKNQFYLLWRYFDFGLCGIALYIQLKKKSTYILEREIFFWFASLPGFIAVLAVLVITNMDVNTTMAKMFISVIGTILLMYLNQKNKEETFDQQETMKNTVPDRLLFIVFVTLFCSLLFGKLIQMRITGCGQITILAPMEKIEEGPAKGIYMISDTATILNADYTVLDDLLTSDDTLLYVGAENLIYLWTGAKIGTPSTQGTNAYNEEFISYFEEHPEKIPTVIVIDKQLGSNPVYYNSSQNYILFQWIDEYYQNAEVLDTDYLTIYIKR